MKCLCFGQDAFADEGHFSWDFSVCDLEDIVYAISMDTGISIVTDDTVSGKGSFKFSGKDFDSAFDSFLDSSRLYVEKKDKLWVVSRFKYAELDGFLYLDAYDLSPNLIVEKLSEKMKTIITFDTLPANPITVHIKSNNEIDLLRKLNKFLYGIEMVEDENSVHFSKNMNLQKKNMVLNNNCEFIKNEDGSFVIDLKDVKISDALEKYFSYSNKDEINNKYCFLTHVDGIVLRSYFTAKSFEDGLEKICNQNGLRVIKEDGIYYIISDKSVIESLIQDEMEWCKINLEHVKASKFVDIVSKLYGKIENIILPDEYSFLIKINKERYKEILKLKDEVDIEIKNYVINLKYIKGEEAIKYIPSSVDRTNLFVTEDNSCIYFRGTEAMYKVLAEQIELCDRPVQRISYDILIMQYDESENVDWSNSINGNRLAYGKNNNIAFQLGDVLGLNLNIISVFGIEFALKLQSALENNKINVIADTTLHGISGKKINFENTSTYRYRDNNLDPETGKPIYSGVTREISSGLKLEISGWISGDGMITSSVTASIGRQGVDTSNSTGNPPPTTEKIVTTEVCGKSGEPVILSGLVHNAETLTQRRVPFISKIPIIGLLFKSFSKTKEKSQMVIYLVPRVQEYGESVIKRSLEQRQNTIESCKEIIKKINTNFDIRTNMEKINKKRYGGK